MEALLSEFRDTFSRNVKWWQWMIHYFSEVSASDDSFGTKFSFGVNLREVGLLLQCADHVARSVVWGKYFSSIIVTIEFTLLGERSRHSWKRCRIL